MAKWADYVLTKVRYDDGGSRIEKVKRREDQEDELGPAETKSRLLVVISDQIGFSYCTATMGSDGWRKGEDVHVVEIDGEKFIRTDQNDTKEDNLGELPEF